MDNKDEINQLPGGKGDNVMVTNSTPFGASPIRQQLPSAPSTVNHNMMNNLNPSSSNLSGVNNIANKGLTPPRAVAVTPRTPREQMEEQIRAQIMAAELGLAKANPFSRSLSPGPSVAPSAGMASQGQRKNPFNG